MPSLAKHTKPWSKEDVALLKKRYAKKMPYREIAAELKRTLDAVKSKAKKLGIASKRK